jgi:virginiamycin B lyase
VIWFAVLMFGLRAGALAQPAYSNIKQYALPTSAGGPEGNTVGPDGALWFTEYSANKIGRITMAGEITEYPISAPNSGPYGITAGSDGALWFTEYGGQSIGRVTTSGIFSEFSVPSPNADLRGITSGPDGALWFGIPAGYPGVARITTAGVITKYAAPGNPNQITTGSDGALWFTSGCCNGTFIGRITTTGTITQYAVPTPDSNPWGIVAGPDGAIFVYRALGQQDWTDDYHRDDRLFRRAG